MDTIRRDVHFTFDQEEKQWLDITDLPSVTFNVHMLACGNGGFFTLRIQ